MLLQEKKKNSSGRYLAHQTSYVTVIKMVSSVDLDFVNRTEGLKRIFKVFCRRYISA